MSRRISSAYLDELAAAGPAPLDPTRVTKLESSVVRLFVAERNRQAATALMPAWRERTAPKRAAE